MALGTNNTGVVAAANFIPEMWSDETVAAYKQNIVMANLVSKMNHKGKKGDSINIPVPARGEATAKTLDTEVTLVKDTAGTIQVSLDKHFEYSYLFEDIADIQSLSSMRRFYTDAAGYGLAKRIDQELHAQLVTLQGGSKTAETWAQAVIGGDGETAFSDAANTNTGNGSTLTDAGIRKMIQTLDDTDTPMMGRFMVLPPVEKNNLTGIARFSEQAFVGDGNTIKNGRIGQVYGMEVYVSTNCPWLHVNDQTGNTSTTFTSPDPTLVGAVDFYGNVEDWDTAAAASTKYRAGAILHKDAIVLAEQLAIRSQAQYIQQHLGTLVTADTIFGVQELRNDAGISFVIPA